MSHSLRNLLFLILIFYTTCIEEKFSEVGENFKPFVSIPNYASFEQNIPKINFLEESTQSDIFSKIKTVRCSFLNDYSLYDISSLGKNSLDESIKEIAHQYDVDIGGKTYSILYNFCYNLKNTKNCPYDKKQIYYIVDGKCHPLAGDIGSGNKWEVIHKNVTNKTEDIIKITVNPEGNHTFEYELSCLEVPEDKKKEEKGKHYVDKAEATIDNGNLKVTFYISSVEACVKVDFYFIFKFVQDYKVIFIILLMLFGILNCGFGRRFSRFTAFFLCLFILTVLVLVLSQYILPSGCKEWIIWVMLGVGILLGIVAGFFAFKYHEGSMAFLTGGIGGFILGEFLFNLFGNKIPINGIAANIIVVVVSIIVLIAIAFFFKKFIVIFGTSLIGSYCFIRGISLFAGHFPDEITIIDLQTGGETEQLKELLTWQVYVYLASIAVATIISMIIQYKTYKEDGETVEGAKDANLMRTAE